MEFHPLGAGLHRQPPRFSLSDNDGADAPPSSPVPLPADTASLEDLLLLIAEILDQLPVSETKGKE